MYVIYQPKITRPSLAPAPAPKPAPENPYWVVFFSWSNRKVFQTKLKKIIIFGSTVALSALKLWQIASRMSAKQTDSVDRVNKTEKKFKQLFNLLRPGLN